MDRAVRYEYVFNHIPAQSGSWQQQPVFQSHRYRLTKVHRLLRRAALPSSVYGVSGAAVAQVLDDGTTRPLTDEELTEFEQQYPVAKTGVVAPSI